MTENLENTQSRQPEPKLFDNYDWSTVSQQIEWEDFEEASSIFRGEDKNTIQQFGDLELVDGAEGSGLPVQNSAAVENNLDTGELSTVEFYPGQTKHVPDDAREMVSSNSAEGVADSEVPIHDENPVKLSTNGNPTTKELASEDGMAPEEKDKVQEANGAEDNADQEKGRTDKKSEAKDVPFPVEYSREEAAKLLEKLSGDDRKKVAEDLGKMGPKVLPDLAKFKDDTKDAEAYRLARQAEEYIRTNSPEEAAKSPFTSKYDAEEVKKNIAALGAGELDRLRAQDKLFSMGRPALPDLQMAAKESTDWKVESGAENVIRRIETQTLTEEIAAKSPSYLKLSEKMRNLLDKAGIHSLGLNYFRSFEPDVGERFYGITGLHDSYDDPPKGKLSNEDREAFKEMIKLGDKLKSDKGFDEVLSGMKTLTEDAIHKGKTASRANDYEKLLELEMSREQGRELYARALSGSGDPKDREEGIRILTEQMSKHKPTWSFDEAAARLGAHKDEAFMNAYKEATGGETKGLDDAVKLRKMADPFPSKYEEDKAAKLLERLTSDKQFDRLVAMEELGDMGPKVMPDLAKFKESTKSADAYLLAENAEQYIRSNSPEEGAKSQFTTKYSDKQAAQYISELNSAEFVDRKRAQDNLVKMGPLALPKLKEATKESEPYDVRVGAESAISRIEALTAKEQLDAIKKSYEKIPELLQKSGIEINSSKILHADGSVFVFDVQMEMGKLPKGTPNAQDRKAFEEMIATGDKLSTDTSFDDKLSALQSKNGDDFLKLATLGLTRTKGREIYARALSGSDDPKDHQKGVELLTEQLSQAKGYIKPSASFNQLAVRLGADKNEAFMAAYKKATFGETERFDAEVERKRKSGSR